ncbi:hypothetical protein GLYMA_19G036450v4 [Glycine max]|nr:hypothetical protein GLYMA_19G036450v4 [Glycine max]KAH1076274.1 hypothetical protein GYH30_051951 [Glycine max]
MLGAALVAKKACELGLQAIKFGVVRFISKLFALADCIQPFSYGITCFVPNNEIVDLRHSVNYILLEQSQSNEDLFVAIVNMFTSTRFCFSIIMEKYILSSYGTSSDELSSMHHVSLQACS